MKLNKEWKFLTATRFWSMVLMALALYLKTDGYISAALADLIATVAGGFVVVKTADRFAENM